MLTGRQEGEQWDVTGMPFPGQVQAEARQILHLLNYLVSTANAMLVFGSYFEKFMGFSTLLTPVIFYTPVTVLHPAESLSITCILPRVSCSNPDLRHSFVHANLGVPVGCRINWNENKSQGIKLLNVNI